MKRRTFVQALLGIASGSAVTAAQEAGGMRRLSSGKSFTTYSAGLERAYTVQLGETVLVDCTHGMPGLVTRDGKFLKPKDGDKINPGTGPIYVEGIAAGDALAIELLDIRPAEWGYCSGRIFELSGGYAIIDKRLRLPLQPMIGQIGIAPSQGTMDSRSPADTGGNMDCKEVRAGSTLVFTAQVKGGLVGMGDAHALQGDGEISGQGIECSAEVIVRFSKLPAKLSDRPVIVRPEWVATVGAHKDLAEAAWQATDDMAKLLAAKTGRDEKDARIIVNLVGNLRINQIVDGARGARMEVPSWAFGV
jgi:amidase